MTRFNETCVLVAKTYEPDDEGVLQVTDRKRTVFCNPLSIGVTSWYSMRETGTSASAEIQVRSCDYEDERDVLYRGVWYSVETALGAGDLRTLVLRHQYSDSDDSPEESGGSNG